MAKRKRNVKIPEGIVDYYAVYSLDRKLGTKEIRKQLMRKQGEIRSNMASGSLNGPEFLEKQQEMYNMVAAAMKIFKNEDRRKEYDLALDAAYEAGKIDIEAQTMAQDLYEEIEAMLLRGNYQGVIRKCMDALNNGVLDYRIYIFMAGSYSALNDPDRSLKAVENGLQVHPENMPLLRAGARYSNEGKHDFNKAQEYINRMLEIDAESNYAVSEQSYLYLCTGKDDLAYQLIDEYVEKHPNDSEFRQNCAHDLVGHSYSCYTKAPDSDAYVIASQEDYQKCLDICNKAASLYNDDSVRTALERAEYFGTVEFNDENKESIMWLFIGGGMYFVIGIIVGILLVMELGTDKEINIIAGIFGAFILGGCPFAIGSLLIHFGKRLYQVSYRPYWQINKFIMTGVREKGEGKYIIIGKIFTWYMRLCVKTAIWTIKFVFYWVFG